MQFELITADGRLFDLDVWDWSMILGGSLLVGLVPLLGWDSAATSERHSPKSQGGEPRPGALPAVGSPNGPDGKKQCN